MSGVYSKSQVYIFQFVSFRCELILW